MKVRRIQLTAKELKSARASDAVVMEHLEQLARTTWKKLGRRKFPGLGSEGISKIIIILHDTNTPMARTVKIFYGKDGKCAGVKEDPPGICRPCNDPSSTDGHAE